MNKKKSHYICQECGYISQKWLGKCPECQKWNCFSQQGSSEETVPNKVRSHSFMAQQKMQQAIVLGQIPFQSLHRQSSSLAELDRVLGGGMVPGASILMGGEPGIGKSTLLLQIAMNLAAKKLRILYASGEENASQVRLRAERLGNLHESLFFLATTHVESLEKSILELKPQLLIVDSIQTSYTDIHVSSPGTIAQVRESAFLLSQLANQHGITLLLIAHVTKEGGIAGPKLLEHLVDCVLYFEGDRFRDFRMIRAFKNRFGAINEIALFQMNSQGLHEIKNPSSYFLEINAGSLPAGTALTAVREGSLIFLMEIQALVSEILYQAPRRASDGLDLSSVQLMSAVLDKFAGLSLRNYDIFIKVSGGIVINDAAADLALLVALISSLEELALQADTIFIGEVSLSGQIRTVPMMQERLTAISSLGFKRVVISEKSNKEHLIFNGEIVLVSSINQVLEFIHL